MQKRLRSVYVILSFIIGIFLLSGCATMQDIVQTFRPELKLKDVHLTKLTFEAADLALDIEVQNPNPLPIAMTGFDYDLKINNISFLTGQQPKKMNIDALGGTVFQIPVSINYKNLYDTFQSLKDQDTTAYHIDCGVSFDLPGLGLTRIPFSTQGDFPALKLPSINVEGLKVKNMTLAGADMELKLQMTNPNAFDLLLNNIDYALDINGRTWAKGVSNVQTQVSQKGESAIGIPISLDFAQIGLGVYQMLSGEQTLDYSLQGKLDVGSSLPLLKNAAIPLNRSGALNILR